MLFLGAGLAVSSYRGKGEGLPAAEVLTQPLFRELPEQSQSTGIYCILYAVIETVQTNTFTDYYICTQLCASNTVIIVEDVFSHYHEVDTFVSIYEQQQQGNEIQLQG